MGEKQNPNIEAKVLSLERLWMEIDMSELDPDSVLDRKLRELCEENSELAESLTGKSGREDLDE